MTTNSSTSVKPCRPGEASVMLLRNYSFLAPYTETLIMWQSYASFVGVDLHKCTVTLTAVDPTGEKLSRLKISTKSTGKIEDWLLDLPRLSWMAIEACPFLDWSIDRFKPCVDRIDIADATELANIRGPKFDSVSAQKWFLANADLLKPVQQEWWRNRPMNPSRSLTALNGLVYTMRLA